jgi:hypothetical protein
MKSSDLIQGTTPHIQVGSEEMLKSTAYSYKTYGFPTLNQMSNTDTSLDTSIQ